MDDLEFRRTVYADPHTEDERVRNSAEEDPSKQAFLDEMKAFDSKLSDALKVPVPDNMAERLILRQTIESHNNQRKRTRVHLALAASLAFAVGLSMQTFYLSSSGDNIGSYSLAHVNHGIQYLYNANENNSVDQVNIKLARFGGKFSSAMGGAVFSNYCDFGGITSLHLIFESDSGRVSVFVTPADTDIKFVEEFGDERFVGKAMAFDKAHVTIVGDKGKELSSFSKKVAENITWEI